MKDAEHVESGFCKHCGGEVDADGYAHGGEVIGVEGSPMPAANDSNPAEDDANVRDFIKALGHKGKR